MKFGVIVFPGSNCDRDCYHVIKHVLKQPVEYIWHEKTAIDSFDCIIVPGGFSYGDYLRAGAIARFSPVMKALKNFSNIPKKYVIGICNGFQILTEAGLLPGALQRNRGLKFICKNAELKVHTTETPFTSSYKKGQIISIPIAHMEGNYTADSQILKELAKNGQIVFTYEANPNGSMLDIAGICNKKRNVLGMMPHPERVSEKVLGSQDGLLLFKSLLASFMAGKEEKKKNE